MRNFSNAVSVCCLKHGQRIKLQNHQKNPPNLFVHIIVITHHISILRIVISELSEDISLLKNEIKDGKHGIIHPQILPPSKLIEGFKQFEEGNPE